MNLLKKFLLWITGRKRLRLVICFGGVDGKRKRVYTVYR
jgi:hypothetical protein